MKRYLQRSLKITFLLAAFMLINNIANSATFTAIASGNWSNSATWMGGTIPSNAIAAGDMVIIPTGITVTMDNNISINGALASLEVNGSLSAATNNSLTVGVGTLTGTGNIAINSIIVNTGAALTFTGNIVVNSMTTAVGSLTTAADIVVAQTLTLASGTLTLQSGGSLDLGNDATIVRSGGALVLSGGTVGLSGTYNVSYTTVSSTAGIELTYSGLNDVTIDVSNGNQVTLTSDLTVNGELVLSSGKLAIASNTLNINGNISPTGNGYISSTSTSSISITSAGGTVGALTFSGSANQLDNLTIDVGAANTSSIEGNLTVNGSMDLASGTLYFHNSSLIINGSLSGSGALHGNSNSNLDITTAGGINSPIHFSSGGSVVNNFKVMVGASNMVTLGSNLTVNGVLNLNTGNLNTGNYGLIISSGGSITSASSNSYIITGPSGHLDMALTAGASASTRFPVGTLAYYSPANILLNTGSASGMVAVNMVSNVMANGTTGADLSINQPLVDATWNISSNITSGLSMNLELTWEAGMEVNSFSRANSRISHFIANEWDASATAAATAEGSGMFSLQRNNITSLSPFAVFDENTTTTGVNELSANPSFSLFPNPANECITINHDIISGKVIYADVLNFSGQVVRTVSLNGNSTEIALEGLSAGSYFIRLYNEEMTEVVRFTKK